MDDGETWWEETKRANPGLAAIEQLSRDNAELRIQLVALEADVARLKRIEAAWWQYCNCGKRAWDFGCPYKCGMLSYCKGIALGGEE